MAARTGDPKESEGRRRRPATRRGARSEPPPEPARQRFRSADAYRADREWSRYAGTPQRQLFRELRRRFLSRHAVADGWTLDVGTGPGRFAPQVGTGTVRRVGLDLSVEMLRRMPAPGAATEDGPFPTVDRVEGDGGHPPFREKSFQEVVLLGNSLGFAGADGPALLAASEGLLGDHGVLAVEIAPGPGERSRYLRRLPPRAAGRLLEAPVAAVVPRVVREPFDPEPERHRSPSFRRWSVAELLERWSPPDWEVREVVAVAPCVGADPQGATPYRVAPRAWEHLLELEEIVGRRPERWAGAAAVLLAVRRTLRRHP